MAKLWARMVMGLIFVFVTISSPLHAQAMPMTGMPVHAASTPATAQQMVMAGMSEDCAKAMAAEVAANDHAKFKPAKAPAGHGKDCCSDGCTCPLSHCPATPPALGFESFVLLPVEETSSLVADTQTLRSYLADTLRRPPKA
jgi:hypothetical protein